MGLPWVRLDTNFGSNPKILYLIEDKKYRAAFVYITGLACPEDTMDAADELELMH